MSVCGGGGQDYKQKQNIALWRFITPMRRNKLVALNLF